MNKPDSITINVRYYAGTDIAKAKELNVRASCTAGAELAAHACAYKVYGAAFTLKKVTDRTFIAEAIKNEPKKTGVWHTDLPDADIQVLVRLNNEEYHFALASYDGEKWMECDEELTLEVRGWLQLHEAAAILDAAQPTA